MPSRYEMRLPFSTTKEIQDWADRYNKNQTGVQKLIEKYLMGLKKTVRELKKPRTPSGYLLYHEFYDLYEWKLKRKPKSLKRNSKNEIQEITGEAFRLNNDWEKLDKLTEIHDVGQSVASAILHLCDQKKYPILDQHALRSVGIDEKYIYGPKYPFWQKYVDFCRAEAERYNVSMRTLDRALWKYSKVGIWENDKLRCRRYPRTGGPLGVTIPNGNQFRYAKQFRRPSGVDTYVEVIEEIGVEKVKSLNIEYGDNPLIDDVYHVGVNQEKSGLYYIRVPGNIYRQGNLLKQVAERLNIDLIVDYFWEHRHQHTLAKSELL